MKVGKLGWLVAMFLSGGMAIAQGTADDLSLIHILEEVRWTDIKNNMPLYDVTFPYIRMMAGPVDYTPGAMRNATRCV